MNINTTLKIGLGFILVSGSLFSQNLGIENPAATLDEKLKQLRNRAQNPFQDPTIPSLPSLNSQINDPSIVNKASIRALQLIEKLSSTDEVKRISAIQGLSDEKHPDVIQTLKRHLKTAVNASPEKAETLSVLLKFGQSGLSEEVKVFQNHPDEQLRMKLAYNARFTQDTKLSPILLQWLEKDLDPFVQEYAALSLGSIGGEQVQEKLGKMMEKANELNPYVASAIGKSVVKLRPITPLLKEEDKNQPLKVPSLADPALKSTDSTPKTPVKETTLDDLPGLDIPDLP